MTKSKVDRQTRQARGRVHRGVQLTGLLLLVAIMAAFIDIPWLAKLAAFGVILVGGATGYGYWQVRRGIHRH